MAKRGSARSPRIADAGAHPVGADGNRLGGADRPSARHRVPHLPQDRQRVGTDPLLDAELVRQCVEDTQRRYETERASNQQLNRKPYFMELTGLDDYRSDSAPFRLATDPSVVKAVADYLGSFPWLYNITAVFSPSSGQTGASTTEDWRGSQLFHRDGEDRRLLKLWVLCGDVAAEHGPTMVLPAALSQRIALRLRYSPGGKLPDEPFLDHWDSLTPAVGAAGTVYATDTARCFHFGSRTLEESSRLVLMVHYMTEQSKYFDHVSDARAAASSPDRDSQPLAVRRLLGAA
mgnify:CR=1 FL=1